MTRNGAPGPAVGYPSPQTQSAFSAYLNYMSPSSGSYPNQMARIRGPSQMSSRAKEKFSFSRDILFSI